jgi:hypothetical protein
MMARAALLPVALLLCLALAGNADARRKAGGGFYELKNKNGDFSIKVTNQGAAIASAIVPDGKGMAAFLLASKSPYMHVCILFLKRWIPFMQGTWLILFLGTTPLLNML